MCTPHDITQCACVFVRSIHSAPFVPSHSQQSQAHLHAGMSGRTHTRMQAEYCKHARVPQISPPKPRVCLHQNPNQEDAQASGNTRRCNCLPRIRLVTWAPAAHRLHPIHENQCHASTVPPRFSACRRTEGGKIPNTLHTVRVHCLPRSYSEQTNVGAQLFTRCKCEMMAMRATPGTVILKST